MDVNAALQRLDSLLISGVGGDECDEICDDIRDWVKRGGFEPSWNKHTLATSYYKSREAMAYRKRID